MTDTINELGCAAERELHSLLQGSNTLEGGHVQSRGIKRGLKRGRDETGLDAEAENMGATIVDGSHQISNIGASHAYILKH